MRGPSSRRVGHPLAAPGAARPRQHRAVGALAGPLPAAPGVRGAAADARVSQEARAGLGGADDGDRARARPRRGARAGHGGHDASAGMLKLGSRGPGVAAMQRALGISADGIFGHQTKRRSRPSRPRTGSRSTGSSGRSRAARSPRRRRRRRRRPVEAPARDHDRGPARARHQRRRRARPTRRGGRSRPFQAAHGLEVDGVVGPQTLGALGISGAAAPVGGGGGAAGAVAAARSQIGKPYALGGVGPSSFDCSGLTQWAMAQVGDPAPAHELRAGERRASTSTARRSRPATSCSSTPTGRARRTSGIATGPTTAISATSHGVREHSTVGSYWGAHYYGARRVG